ncbi:MAG TPA: exo-alpha-sialidase [Candidatus Bathyarchaeia archaeon]|nr:exo-alpha-sialidase [Candidatus Bathyarchaeia archaeon]
MTTIFLIAVIAFPVRTITPSANTPHQLALSQLTVQQQRLLSGLSQALLSDHGDNGDNSGGGQGNNYTPTNQNGCGSPNYGNNIKVNQDCTRINGGSPQNEPGIAIDKFNPQHVVASYNDYRRGDGTCGTSYSLDGGQTWKDSTVANNNVPGAPYGAPPFGREYFQASGDTSVAWDTRGNAYVACQEFDRPFTTNSNDTSSGIYVYRSTQNNGGSWNYLPNFVAANPDFANEASLLDKPYMTVDNNVNSPFRDRVYVSWTLFAADGTAKIYEAYSASYGQTWSSSVLVTTTSSYCPNSVSTPGTCDANQDSQPFVASDGTLYIVFNNYNNALSSATDNRNQILIAKSTTGGASFSPLVKVSDFFDLPDCATYQNGQDFGRACIPEKGSQQNSVFRAVNYPSGSANPTDPNAITVTFGSYINVHSNEANGCVPNSFSSSTGQNLFTGVKTPGACNNDILISVSTNAGASFTGTTTDPRALATVTQTTGQATTDQWWEWASYNNNGRLFVSYYDRQYGNDESNGQMDISVSGSIDLVHFSSVRVSSSSMPLSTQFRNGRGNSLFFGDYAGLSAVNAPIPIWADTRNFQPFLCPGTATPGNPPQLCSVQFNTTVSNDQDIYVSVNLQNIQ